MILMLMFWELAVFPFKMAIENPQFVFYAIFFDNSVRDAYSAPPEKADLRGVGQKEGEPGPGAIPRIKLVLLGDSVRATKSSESVQLTVCCRCVCCLHAAMPLTSCHV